MLKKKIVAKQNYEMCICVIMLDLVHKRRDIIPSDGLRSGFKGGGVGVARPPIVGKFQSSLA